MKNAFLSPAVLSLLLLSACGGSGGNGNDTFNDSYIQFYNGSANSATTLMAEVDGNLLGSATYGDASSLITLEKGELELEFYRIDADDQEVTLEEMTVNLKNGDKSLIILSGDYETPSFIEYTYTREDLEDHFRVFATSVIADGQSYDLYMSEAGEPFSAANFLGAVNYQQLDEFEYWDGDSDSDDFDEGEYIIYLTESGSTEPFFESATISFAFDTEYVIALRTTTGAIQDNVVVDLIINSSSVGNYADDDATAQYRIYNSLDDDASIDLTLAGNDDNTEQELSLGANELSDFTEIEFGDYRLSASLDESTAFNNRLITLNQGESKAVVLYRNADEALTAISFEESNLPQVFDHQIQIVNLAPDFFDIDFYFVRKDETIESAEYLVAGLDYEESRSITLPSDFYELIAVFEDNNDTQVLLDRTELLGINEEVNYIITVEKTDDSATGFEISVLN
ncbi:DUF4397 domain-containing protein [Paraglaciecola sp. 2405UD69-4]|uniref:DUF4397 domain-containing protein n=1 Tax=Paraglaciecola sp. 2405UD69-4 TaxID=3391836 RepID=UPI0039C97FAB